MVLRELHNGVAVALFFLTSAAAQPSRPQVPENLQAPSEQAVLFRFTGKGKQVYVCGSGAADKGHFEWTLEKPDAVLINEQGTIVGKHYAGPAWEASDGSTVTGQVQQRVDAPGGAAIPWLLLKTASHQGQGTFARVAFIQRVDTVGGLAPAGGCDKSKAGDHVAVDYRAIYYFYAPRN
jgi:hypothetical protein